MVYIAFTDVHIGVCDFKRPFFVGTLKTLLRQWNESTPWYCGQWDMQQPWVGTRWLGGMSQALMFWSVFLAARWQDHQCTDHEWPMQLIAKLQIQTCITLVDLWDANCFFSAARARGGDIFRRKKCSRVFVPFSELFCLGVRVCPQFYENVGLQISLCVCLSLSWIRRVIFNCVRHVCSSDDSAALCGLNCFLFLMVARIIACKDFLAWCSNILE